MLVLVVDSSTPAVSAGVVEVGADAGVRLLAGRRTVDARAHGELLAPQITEVLAEVGARPAGLAAIVAGTGPGPFTGLRVGLATAASMGQALGIPTYGVCSLDGLGAVPTGAATLVATDARRREVYWAVYDRRGLRVAGPAVERPAQVAALAREHGAVVAVGEGARRYADQLGLPVSAEPAHPDLLVLAGLAADRVRERAPAEALTPRYLRRPDAVEPGARKPVTAR